MNFDRSSIAPRAASRAAAFTIPLTVFFLATLSLVLLLWTNRIYEVQRSNFALLDTVMHLRIRAATFHLWLEEYIGGKTEQKSLPEIWRDLDRSLYLSETLFRGGTSEVGAIVEPLQDPALRARAKTIHVELQEFRSIASERLRNLQTSGIDSLLDERFDGAYRDLQQSAHALERLMEEGEVANHTRLRRLVPGAFALWLLISGVATLGLLNHQRRRFRAEEGLQRAREDLELANQGLEERIREKTNSLQTANVVLTQAQEELIDHQDRLRALSSQLTLTEERERRRLATELHDRIGTVLALAKMKLASTVGPALGLERCQDAAEGLRLLEQAMDAARSLTFELCSPVLYELGLEAALEWLAGWIRKEHGLPVTFQGQALPRPVPEHVAVLLFQAARELLVNVVKHARASAAWITCEEDQGDIRIVVGDDGVGFDASQSDPFRSTTGSFGLFSVRERLGSLGGLVEIESGSEGTRVTLGVPLEPLPERGE